MKKQLNKKQRKFLEYIRDEHESLGWKEELKQILKQCSYNTTVQKYAINKILTIFNKIKNNDTSYINIYGKPTKYLK